MLTLSAIAGLLYGASAALADTVPTLAEPANRARRAAAVVLRNHCGVREETIIAAVAERGRITPELEQRELLENMGWE